MAEIYKEQCNSQAFKELSFDERLAFMVDEEVNDKYNNLVTGIQRRSKNKNDERNVGRYTILP